VCKEVSRKRLSDSKYVPCKLSVLLEGKEKGYFTLSLLYLSKHAFMCLRYLKLKLRLRFLLEEGRIKDLC
jgi:hypothetical protein